MCIRNLFLLASSYLFMQLAVIWSVCVGLLVVSLLGFLVGFHDESRLDIPKRLCNKLLKLRQPHLELIVLIVAQLLSSEILLVRLLVAGPLFIKLLGDLPLKCAEP